MSIMCQQIYRRKRTLSFLKIKVPKLNIHWDNMIVSLPQYTAACSVAPRNREPHASSRKKHDQRPFAGGEGLS